MRTGLKHVKWGDIILKVLIEFYDRSVLKNMAAALALKPDHLIFFYDREMFSDFEVYSTYLACKKYLPALKVELRTVDYHDYTMIDEKMTECINDNSPDTIYIDLTGGSELMTIAGYKAGQRANVSVFFSDIYKNEVVDLDGKWPKFKSLPFELCDMIEACGGQLVSYTDSEWLDRHMKGLYAVAKAVLSSPKLWAKTCRYFQKYRPGLKGRPLHFEKTLYEDKKSQEPLPDKRLLYQCQSGRLIENLIYTPKLLSFDYTCSKASDYMASYGIWLELFTYKTMKEISGVRDVKTSIKIDWNRQDDIEIIGNEVDVTAMYGCRPVVISCKQSTNPITADALNELYVVARRIGGKYSIPILITRSDVKSRQRGIYMKAREMRLHLLDASDILSKEFKLRLWRTIKDN